MTATTPRETDTKLAELWTAIYAARDRQDQVASSLKSMAGAKAVYRGRQRVLDMSTDVALTICQAIMDANAEESDYARFDLAGPALAGSWSLGQVRSSMAKWDELEATLVDLVAHARELEATYTGWSRFFLVTSSAGHIHSSTCCSTCRVTTRYGWLPQLSGKDEATAVGELGPTLCSVCFPSAPVEFTTGRKLTAAQAAKLAA